MLRLSLAYDVLRLMDTWTMHDLLHALTRVAYDKADLQAGTLRGENWREVARQLAKVEDFATRMTL